MIRSRLSREKSRTIHRLLGQVAACVCAWSLAATCAFAQAGRARFPLTSDQIIAAMQGRQLPTQGVQVKMPAPMTSSNANAQLEIKSVTPLNSHQLRMRIGCRVQSDCLPFFALAVFPEDSIAGGMPVKLERQPAASKVPPTLRAGSPATLEIEGDRVHLHFDVICLESGWTGDRIRVQTRDHKQSYVARIVTPTLLKGSL